MAEVLQSVGAHAAVTLTEDDPTLAIAAPEGAAFVLVQVFGDAVRYTLDGSAPTPSHGFALAGGPLVIPVASGVTVTFARSANDSRIQYQWGQYVDAE